MAAKTRPLYPSDHLTKDQLELRTAAENRFAAFVRLVAPWLEMGHIHYEVCDWMQNNQAAGVERQLVLLPRAHLKSTLAYLWACWKIVRNPSLTLIYMSASATLAEMQLSSIKNTLAGDVVSFYWPGLVGPDEGKRTVWRSDAITVDHWMRQERGTRDFTIRAAGVGHGVTGSHCDELVYDDVVAPESDQYSPWTRDGREKLKTRYSFMTSVLNTGGSITVLGTRYHDDDLYGTLIGSKIPHYDDKGLVVGEEPEFAIMLRTVETNGQYLWPRQKGHDGNWYGFDDDELAKKRRGYLDKTHFYSQYYQNPSNREVAGFVQDFRYYDSEKLFYRNGLWYVAGDYGSQRPLNVFASIDIASTKNKNSDYTAITVVGVDSDNTRYVLDIARFKTDRISEMTEHIFTLYVKWRWKRFRVECTAAQRFVYTSLIDEQRIRNIFFPIDEYSPRVAEGKKQERINATLEPLYKNGLIVHFRGGLCEILEQELVLERPPHDDIADSLASTMEIAYAPVFRRTQEEKGKQGRSALTFHPRFGGVS